MTTEEPRPTGSTELVPIDSIEPHPDNPRLGDVSKIATLIATNGFYGHVIVQLSRRRIVVGHHRWRALRELQRDGWKPPRGNRVTYAQLSDAVQLPPLGLVPVEWYDVDDDTARRSLVGDNAGSDAATWDDPVLARLLAEMRAEDELLLGTGFTGRDVDDLLAKLDVPDLADLAAQLGEPSVSDFWPVLRLKVHPETAKLWHEVVARLASPDAGDDDAVRAVLRALPT